MDLTLTLHPKQGKAFLSEATEILYGGAAYGGKSHLMRAAAISWSYDIPGINIYLFRRTHPDLFKNHMEGPTGFPAMLAPWIEKKLVKINYSDGTIEFMHNKSKIFLCHCQYEKDRWNYRGAEIHVLLIDELTSFTEVIYRFLRSRVRLGGLVIPEKYRGLFPRVLCGTNPGDIGHTWVKQTWIDFANPFEIKKVSRKEGGMKRQYIPALLEDNPTADREEYESKLEGLGHAALVKAMRWGIWEITPYGAIDDLWDKNIHILPWFEIPNSWYVDRSFDWGSSSPSSIGFWAESDGCDFQLPDDDGKMHWLSFYPGTLIRINELYTWNGHANQGNKMIATEIAKEIKEIEKNIGHYVHPGPADNQIFRATEGRTIAEKMATMGVRWTGSDKDPGSRVTGLEQLRERLKASLQYPMEAPGIYTMNNCRHFIRTIPVLPRNERKPDDVDTNSEDHVWDETRYRLLMRKYRVSTARVLGV